MKLLVCEGGVSPEEAVDLDALCTPIWCDDWQTATNAAKDLAVRRGKSTAIWKVELVATATMEPRIVMQGQT